MNQIKENSSEFSYQKFQAPKYFIFCYYLMENKFSDIYLMGNKSSDMENKLMNFY